MSAFSLSRHAEVRLGQRGVTAAMLGALIEHADIESPVGGGCYALALSRRARAGTDLRAALGDATERLADLSVVVSEDGTVVTVLHRLRSRAGRRYACGA